MLSRLTAAATALILSPIYVAVGLVVQTQLGRPVLFFQTRVGQGYRPFQIYKFRTMQDGRTTAVTRWLRRSRLDELPQLINIMRGDMAFIGPRPEVPKFVIHSPLWSQILSVKPGLFDAASRHYLNEERLLSVAVDPEEAYRAIILPEKLVMSVAYLARRSARTDAALLVQTIWLVLKGIIVGA